MRAVAEIPRGALQETRKEARSKVLELPALWILDLPELPRSARRKNFGRNVANEGRAQNLVESEPTSDRNHTPYKVRDSGLDEPRRGDSPEARGDRVVAHDARHLLDQ